MKKLILSLVAAIVAATASYAQNTLVATLTHGDDVTMFYGTYALRDAHNAAVSGDVINLSGGSFQAVSITKGITIRGTGIQAASPTYIPDQSITISIPSTDTNRFMMEGIICNASIAFAGTFTNAYFSKCQFKTIYYSYPAQVTNTVFADCIITESFSLENSSTVQFINSFINHFGNGNNNENSATFVNCVIMPQIYKSKNGYENIRRSLLMNCIICKDYNYGYSYFPNTTTVTNCIIQNDVLNLLQDSPASTGCWAIDNYTPIFTNFTGTYSEGVTFELLDEIQENYLGTDGTQVGMYGGIMPYTPVPSYPQITKMNVANKTTADGKLSVEIEVGAAE